MGGEGSDDDYTTPNNYKALPPLLSSKMKLVISSPCKTIATKNGRYGQLNFLDNQIDFAEVFGPRPSILYSRPTSNDSSFLKQKIISYSES